MTDDDAISPPAPRGFPPEALASPPPSLRRILTILWWLLFAMALAGILVGLWRGVAERQANDGFARIGVQAMADPVSGCVIVTPTTELAMVAWPVGIDPMMGGCLVMVGDTEIQQYATLADVAPLLVVDDLSAVPLAMYGADGTPGQGNFMSTESNLAQEGVSAGFWFEVGQLAAYTIAALLYAAVALLLRVRRRGDPVSGLMSFAFVLMANLGLGVNAFWQWVGYPFVPGISMLAGLSLLVIAFPAFPDGRFVPRLSRWLLVLAPLLMISTFLASIHMPESALVAMTMSGTMLIFPLVGLALLVLRYVRMPRGLERQQVKWAVFGLTVGLLLALLTTVIMPPDSLMMSNPDLFLWLWIAHTVATVLGFVLMPLGVAVSLTRYRLNDADAAMSKSLGYALVTLIIGVAWAIISSVVNRYVGQVSTDPMVATGLTTVIAALVFTPARTRVLGWTEAKFQRALVALRSLPGKLVRWQTSETPEELAEAALRSIVDGVSASYAALVGEAEEEGRPGVVLAAIEVDPDFAREQAGAERPEDRREDPFPIRVTLADKLGEQGELMIGPRSDGASYTRDERSAIASVCGALTDALRAATRRTRQTTELQAALATLEDRLREIEAERVADPAEAAE